MRKRCLAFFLTLCMVLSLVPVFSTPARAYSVSDWVLESAAPAGAEIVDRKWTYTKTTYQDSKSATAPSGYQLKSKEWKANGSGSTKYASFPSGFDTNSDIYKSFKNTPSCPYSSYSNATSKREVSDSWGGYVYWHWMYDTDYANGTSTRAIYNQYGWGPDNGFLYKFFGAFESNEGNYSSDTGYCNSRGIRNYIIPGRTKWADCQGATRWFRFEYRKASYTDYYMLFHYYKTEQLESSTAITQSSSSTVVINNIKEYVKYKNSFTITYDANGGENAPAPQTKQFGTPLTITSAQPTRTGYEFLGWSVSREALAATYAPGSSFTADSDYTLYAIWQNKTLYTVTYDYKTNGGTSSTLESDSVYHDENANLSVNAVKDGWQFVGWNTDSHATMGLSSLSVTDHTTLYAIFSKTASANLYIGEKSLYSTTTKTYYNNEEGASITLPQIPDYPGWTPVCWVSSSDNQDLAAGSTVTYAEDTDFYAKYVKNLTLSYDANGGSPVPPAQQVALYFRADGAYIENEPVLAGAISRTGYSFNKWAYGSPDGDAFSAGDTVNVRENVVMYATWTELPTLNAPTVAMLSRLGGRTYGLSTTDAGADIYYTLDGSSPTAQSTKYEAPIELNAAGEYTLKAIAIKKGYTDSPVTIETITINSAPKPVASVESGYVRADVGIVLSSEAENGTIYYTTDGSEPTLNSNVYSEPLYVSSDFTLKAMTALPGHACSESVSYEYKKARVFSVDNYGYSFVNAASSFGYSNTMPSFLNYCIPYSSVKMIFGDSVKGKSVYTSMAKYPWSGNCCGMASTSALIFSTNNDLTADTFGQTSVNRLRVTDKAAQYDDLLVRTFIEAMQTSQYTVQFNRDYSTNKVSNTQVKQGANMNALYDAVTADLDQNKTDIIAVGKSGVGAHALLAYEMKDVSSAESRLYVYDCNYPNDSDRFVTLRKDASGNVTGWSYPMGKYGTWGTESSGNSYISYIPYDTTEYIWENRGRLFNNYITLTVSSDNVGIYNLDRELVGEFKDGEFYTTKDDVYDVPNLSLSSEADLSVYLPEDYYIVSNRDGGDFEASMVGDSIGASVSTNAETVCFEMNEALRLNNIAIEQAGSDSNYTISLDSSYISTDDTAVFRNVTISGSGIGETMRLSSNASGNPVIENCTIGSYKINGVEQINYMITALAGSGGSISPKGDVSVPAGTDKTFTITPKPGYVIKDVLVDGYSVGAESSFTFEAVGKDHMIRAIFEQAFAIEDIQTSGKTLTVDVKNASAARLYAAVYDADGKMVEIVSKDISRDSSTAKLTLKNALPNNGVIKVFMVSKKGTTPLCSSTMVIV